MLTSCSRRWKVCLTVIILFLLSSIGTVYSSEKIISLQEAELIGELIFQNECAGKDANLLYWNDGENFPSLGIGHFIWYPANYNGYFDESFPKLLLFLQGKGIALPDWFQTLSGLHAPWPTKSDFLKALENGDLKSLREFLIETKSEQAIFLIERFSQSVFKMLQTVPREARQSIQRKLSLMLKANEGLYPLVDYVNFNGEGILESERYQGQGWGLLQVLEEMEIPEAEKDAVGEFVRATEVILDRRVDNSPIERNEGRWLAGWKIRMQTYLIAQSHGEPWADHPLREALLSSVAGEVPMMEKTMLPSLEDMTPPPAVTR
jgi:hypothetical protein